MDAVELDKYWRFVLSLEDDLIVISRYVEPIEANFNTTSIEISKLHNTACAGIETLAKALCCKIDGKPADKKNVNAWATTILADDRVNSITTSEVTISSFSLTRTPWAGWKSGKSPGWWSSHNGNKHRGFATSSYIDCIDAVCALFVMYMLYDRNFSTRIGLPSPRTRLVGMEYWPRNATMGEVVGVSLALS
jgi:hypothetical protein